MKAAAVFAGLLVVGSLSSAANWRRSIATSKMDDTTTLTVETKDIVARCADGWLEVIVRIPEPAHPDSGDDSAQVRVRFDAGAAKSERWTEATSDRALFAQWPVATAREMASASKMLL